MGDRAAGRFDTRIFIRLVVADLAEDQSTGSRFQCQR